MKITISLLNLPDSQINVDALPFLGGMENLDMCSHVRL